MSEKYEHFRISLKTLQQFFAEYKKIRYFSDIALLLLLYCSLKCYNKII